MVSAFFRLIIYQEIKIECILVSFEWSKFGTRGVHRAGQNLPCSGQDTGQISRNTRCAGQGRFETWTGQVRTGWCPHALEIL